MMTMSIEIPGYVVLHTLGSGGMGTVYEAEQEALARRVAIKVLNQQLGSDLPTAERFVREAQSVASLNHPNIAQVFSAGSWGDVHYMVMELLHGSCDERIPSSREISGRRWPEAPPLRRLRRPRRRSGSICCIRWRCTSGQLHG